MQVRDVIFHLARKARLVVKGRPDNKFLRFRSKVWTFSFIISSIDNIVGYKWINPPNKLDFSRSGLSEEFDICSSGSLRKILTFMRND